MKRRRAYIVFGRLLVWAVVLAVACGCEDDQGGGDIAIVQYQVQDQHSVGSDLDRVAGFVRQAARHGATLVVLPETPFYRYSPNVQNGVSMADLAASHDNLLSEFSALASDLSVSVVVGMREPAGGGGTFNTAHYIGPNGSVLATHRKRLPSVAEASYTRAGGGGSATVFQTPMGRVALAICKDVHVASVRQSVVAAGADLFILPAADENGQTLSPIAEACASAQCMGIVANQAFGAGNSAFVQSDGTIGYAGGGEKIIYGSLP